MPNGDFLRADWLKSKAPEQSGAAVAILAEQRVERIVAFGHTGDRTEMSARSVFDGASLTKQIIFRYVLTLAARGLLELDAPIDAPAAVFGAAPDPRLRLITPAMLLSHAAGFPNWRSPGEPLRLIADPGTGISYSGEGFEYLVAWQRWLGRDVIAECQSMMDGLGMSDSSLTDVIGAARGRPVSGLPADGISIRVHERPWPGHFGPLHTSARDFAVFVTSFIWDSDRVGALTATVAARSGGRERTLGWAREMSDAGPVLWQHGDNPGFKHIVAVRPDAGDGLIALTNSDRGVTFTRAVGARYGVPPDRH